MLLRRFSAWYAGSFLITLLAVAPAHALCGDGVWEEGEQCDDGNSVTNDTCSNDCRLSCETLNNGLTVHTCGHGQFGPFVAAGAQAYPGFVYTDVSAPHTYFTLTMSGDPGANRSGVLYSPGADDLYAFYLKEQYAFSVLSPEGDSLPLLFEHEISCPLAPQSLTWVKVYDLSSTGTYTLTFGPTETTTVAVAVEYVGSQSPAFIDGDGDYYGGVLAGLLQCERTEAVVDVPGDCDDSDATIYPDAPELCDGIDSDCSGDEDTGAPGLCDGDGAGTACVEAGAVIRCGCAADADCGGEAICNVEEQRCESEAEAGGAGGDGGGNAGEPGTTGGAAGEPNDRGESGAATGGSSAAGRGGSSAAGRGGSSAAGRGGSSAAGRGGAAGSSGVAGRDGVAGKDGGEAGGAATAGSGNGTAPDSGCGCRTASAGRAPAVSALLAIVLAGLIRRRRTPA